jgi:hypothetical protein
MVLVLKDCEQLAVRRDDQLIVDELIEKVEQGSVLLRKLWSSC